MQIVEDAPFVGIDLGIESLITLSNGKKIPGRKRKLERQKERQCKLRVNARKGSKQHLVDDLIDIPRSSYLTFRDFIIIQNARVTL